MKVSANWMKVIVVCFSLLCVFAGVNGNAITDWLIKSIPELQERDSLIRSLFDKILLVGLMVVLVDFWLHMAGEKSFKEDVGAAVRKEIEKITGLIHAVMSKNLVEAIDATHGAEKIEVEHKINLTLRNILDKIFLDVDETITILNHSGKILKLSYFIPTQGCMLKLANDLSPETGQISANLNQKEKINIGLEEKTRILLTYPEAQLELPSVESLSSQFTLGAEKLEISITMPLGVNAQCFFIGHPMEDCPFNNHPANGSGQNKRTYRNKVSLLPHSRIAVRFYADFGERVSQHRTTEQVPVHPSIDHMESTSRNSDNAPEPAGGNSA
ncbi:MAG: hypothetical protein HOP03_03700 [Lysobacter sp.]|nr:hypothetical protein [Lysobacter sp.]